MPIDKSISSSDELRMTEFSPLDVSMMQRALFLAKEQIGHTGDNPSVGCLITDKAGRILAEGATCNKGRTHGEEVALAKLQNGQGIGTTVYVTLEPCAKRSKGGKSCTDQLIEHGVGRIVMATHDPHPLVNGQGLQRFKKAGIKTEVGLMEAEARELYQDFFEHVKTL